MLPEPLSPTRVGNVAVLFWKSKWPPVAVEGMRNPMEGQPSSAPYRCAGRDGLQLLPCCLEDGGHTAGLSAEGSAVGCSASQPPLCCVLELSCLHSSRYLSSLQHHICMSKQAPISACTGIKNRSPKIQQCSRERLIVLCVGTGETSPCGALGLGRLLQGLTSAFISVFPLSPFPIESRVLCHFVLTFPRAFCGTFGPAAPGSWRFAVAELLLQPFSVCLQVQGGCRELPVPTRYLAGFCQAQETNTYPLIQTFKTTQPRLIIQ